MKTPYSCICKSVHCSCFDEGRVDCHTGWWFSTGIPVSSTNKTDRHDITEILLKVSLNTINHVQTKFTHKLYITNYYISLEFKKSKLFVNELCPLKRQNVLVSTLTSKFIHRQILINFIHKIYITSNSLEIQNRNFFFFYDYWSYVPWCEKSEIAIFSNKQIHYLTGS